MKKIFIGIGIIILIGLMFSIKFKSHRVDDSVLVVPDIPEEYREEEEVPETIQEHKYYFKGKEITKEQYEMYQSQIEILKQEIQIIKAAGDEYERNRPKITYRRYSDGRVETRIDE